MIKLELYHMYIIKFTLTIQIIYSLINKICLKFICIYL